MLGPLRLSAKIGFVSYHELIATHSFVVHGKVIIPDTYNRSGIYQMKVIRVLKGHIQSDTIRILGRINGCTGNFLYSVEEGMELVVFLAYHHIKGYYGASNHASVVYLRGRDQRHYLPEFIEEYKQILSSSDKSGRNKKVTYLLVKYADKGFSYGITEELLECPFRYRPYMNPVLRSRLAEAMIRCPDGDCSLLMLIPWIGQKEWCRIRPVILDRLDASNYDRTDELMYCLAEGLPGRGLDDLLYRFSENYNALTLSERQQLVDEFRKRAW